MTTRTSVKDISKAKLAEAILAGSANMDGAAIEELINLAQDAPEPGEPVKSATANANRESVGELSITDLQTAGWRYVWDRFTGERSLCNNNMLARQLDKRDVQGRRIFTTVKPAIEPVRGILLCLLAQGHPNRRHMDELGFPVCPKANLRTALDVRTHMQHRHKREWGALEEERNEQIRGEEAAMRQAIIANSAPRQGPPATGHDLPVDRPPRKPRIYKPRAQPPPVA